MSSVELSIIIPALNEENYLPRLLNSIKRQHYSDYEIIVADAGSTDDTVQIARDNECIVIKGGNPSFGKNEGVKIAKGRYLFFFDADVILPDNFLNLFMKKVKSKNIEVASCAVIPMGNNKADKIVLFIFNCYDFFMQLFSPHDAGGFCMFSSKHVHNKINGFDPSLGLGEDHDYALRAGRSGKFRFFWTPKILMSVRRYEQEGRLKLYSKHVAYEAIRMVVGDKRAQIIKYNYDYKKNGKKIL